VRRLEQVGIPDPERRLRQFPHPGPDTGFNEEAQQGTRGFPSYHYAQFGGSGPLCR
jgi:hypothetical protein